MSKGFESPDPRSTKFKARLIKAIKSRDSDHLDATINWGYKKLGEKILTEIIINLHLDSSNNGLSKEDTKFYWSWIKKNIKAAGAWKEVCDMSKSHLIDSLTKQGLILGQDFSSGAKGELIMSDKTIQKVWEMIPDYHDKISFHEQLKSIENNISLKEMATNTGANPDYFKRLFIRAKRRLEPYIMADDGYFFWDYTINFIEGTEIKFPELKGINFDDYVWEQVASPTALKH